jgi:serine phosphatase RsbU (regulator of sigma subunit)
MKAEALDLREPAGVESARAPSRPNLVALPELETLDDYLASLVHDWCRTLTALGFTLIPLFYVLDMVMMPRELLPRFAAYRLVPTALVVAQFFVVRHTRSSRWSVLHGYFFSLIVGAMIALMTTELGGFHSTYYAGLNLVIIAVNLLLPWKPIHTALTSALTIGLYIAFNLIIPQKTPLQMSFFVNNMYFLVSTAVIAVSINAVKHRLIVKEFLSRRELKEARDALWSEMGVAKQIQTALLPNLTHIGRYEIAAVMQPADEVGGDYYDVIETPGGDGWVTIGDVSGHGVESGLVMMMAQTSLLTTVLRTPDESPSRVLGNVNRVIKENVQRLGADRYMTMTALRLGADRLTFAGHHQDLLVHRADRGAVDVIETSGTWLGIIDDLEGFLVDTEVNLHVGDVLLLYTDGVTEATNDAGEMYGEERLRAALARHAQLDVRRLIDRLVDEVARFTAKQTDDVTFVAIRRKS